MRPGRFDRHVVVPNPDIKGRRQILESHFTNVPRAPDVDFSVRFLMRQSIPRFGLYSLLAVSISHRERTLQLIPLGVTPPPIFTPELSHPHKQPMIGMQVIARGTPGFSGADLANLVNIAALKAASDAKKAVSMADLEHARHCPP